MAITLKRQLDEAEKQIILERHGRKCFATGHEIPESDKLQFDHIRAHSRGGESELDNIAPMCEHHNKAKGTLTLEDFRIKLRLEGFFNIGTRLTLKDLLEYLREKGDVRTFGESIAVKPVGKTVHLSNHSYDQTFELQQCPLTGWDYFYANLPISILNSDDDVDGHSGLQPRYLIYDKVFEMFRHFQFYPVLQPSIGRIQNNKILLFDGQHKAAALLWNGRQNFDCKVYLAPDIRILNQANISAHDKFAQTRFFSSIMILKLGSQFGKDFEEYRDLDDHQTKSEKGFVEYLARKDTSLSKAEISKRFRSYLYNTILENDDNKLRSLVSTSNRSSNDQPLTIDMLSKSLFACFLYQEPVQDDMLSDRYKRDVEADHILRLFNIIWDIALSSWNSKAGAHDTLQIKQNRIFSSKSMMAWSEIFRDAVCAKLEIHDSDEREKPFYRELSAEDFSKIRGIFDRLFNWQLWSSPPDSDIDSMIAGNKSALKTWFNSKGLTTGFLLGAPI